MTNGSFRDVAASTIESISIGCKAAGITGLRIHDLRHSYASTLVSQAVIDGYLIDHEPPVRIETALARAGIIFKKDEQLDMLNTSTGEIDLVHAPDEIRFEVDQFNKRVITPEFNRVVAEELANHIDPDAPGAGKTLIFAATDPHADIVVSAVKKAFAAKYGDIDDAAVKKITGSVDNVRTLIRSTTRSRPAPPTCRSTASARRSSPRRRNGPRSTT